MIIHEWKVCENVFDDLSILENYNHIGGRGKCLFDAHIVPINASSNQASSHSVDKRATSSSTLGSVTTVSDGRSLSSLSSKKVRAAFKGSFQEPASDAEDNEDPIDDEAEQDNSGVQDNQGTDHDDDQVDVHGNNQKDDENIEEQEEQTLAENTEVGGEKEVKDDMVHIRLGTYPWVELNSNIIQNAGETDDGVKYDVLLVLEVDLGSDGKEYSFLLVNTWRLNGVQLGYLKMGEWFEKELYKANGEPLHWTPDDAFKNCTSKEEVKDLAVEFAQEERKNGRPNSLLELLPIQPTYSDDEPPELPSPKKKTSATAVIFFINDTDLGGDLELPVNLQAHLDPNDVYDDFEKYLLHNVGEQNFQGLEPHLSQFLTKGWDIDVYILPQVQGAREMFNWKGWCSLTVKQRLDLYLSRENGKKLYIEVHVVKSEKDADGLRALDGVTKKGKGRTGRTGKNLKSW